jgi:hypothetical protein
MGSDIGDIKIRLTGVENRLIKLETDLGEVKAEFRFQRWILGVIVAVMLGVLWKMFSISQQLAALTAAIAQTP